jgi:hypothetical protein
METKLRFVTVLFLGLCSFAFHAEAWTGTRMRKSSAPPPPVSFESSTITTIRPGQTWQLSASGGTTPYSFSLQSGSGSVSSTGVYTAATAISAAATIRVTDAAGATALTTITNSLASVWMTNGTLQIVADPQFLLYDSGGPSGNYGDAEASSLIIRSDRNSTTVSLTFDSFQTESNYDFLKTFDGDNAVSPLNGYSGNSIPPVQSANTGGMLLSFSSDSNTVASGYKAHASILPASVSLLHRNKYATELSTPENFVATGGRGPYTYSVLSGPGSIATSVSDPSIGVYTPGATVGDVTVRVTDATGTTFDESFSVGETNTLCTQTSSSAARGVLYDNGGPNNPYTANSNCGFLISNAGTGTVELKFDYVQTELGYDLIKVYDGSNASGTLLATYSGYFPATATLTASSGSMYITFVADMALQYHGFRATWKILP